jgi:hypothetical protein
MASSAARGSRCVERGASPGARGSPASAMHMVVMGARLAFSRTYTMSIRGRIIAVRARTIETRDVRVDDLRAHDGDGVRTSW